MSETEEPSSLKQILFETAESLEELVALTWLEEHGNEGPVDVERFARECKLGADAAAPAFEQLAVRGVLAAMGERPTRFRYAPDEAQRGRIRRVVGEYRENPIVVMRLMTDNAIERVRSAAVRAFAESFRLRRPR